MAAEGAPAPGQGHGKVAPGPSGAPPASSPSPPPPPQPPSPPAAATAATAPAYSFPYPYYYPPYYPYGYGQAAPRRKLEPRRLRTTIAFDTGVFGLLLLAAAFAWSALVAAVAAAALLPSIGGSPSLGTTESSWLEGVMNVRVVVWLVFALAFMVTGAAFYRFHEGREEFGIEHERNYRDFQAAAAVFLALVGGAGLLTFILSNPGEPRFPAPPANLAALKASITLSALIWGAACAAAAVYFGGSLTRLLRPFLSDEMRRKLSLVPVFFLFIPLFHAVISAAFLNMVDPGNATWDGAKVHAVGEVGGLAGALAAIPLLILVRAFREAHERIVTGKVKPVEPEPAA